MATPRPLKLTQESYSASQTPARALPVAKVLVKVPTSTINSYWDFLIPEELSEIATVGQLVLVPFGNRQLEGYIRSRGETGEPVELKFITKVVSSIPPLSPSQFILLDNLSDRFECSASEFLDSIIPPFSRTGERRIPDSVHPLPPSSLSTVPTRELRVIPQSSTLNLELFKIIDTHSGKKIFIFPEMSQLETFSSQLQELNRPHLLLHSQLSKSDRYEAYLAANGNSQDVVLGLRSSVMLGTINGDILVVIDDADSSHYEMRAPTWNSRDVALLRANFTNIIFLCHAPSLELVRLHTLHWLPSTFSKSSQRKRISADSESTESTYRSLITESLRSGSVLVIQNVKGYIRSFTCNDCRNIALCECGGKLSLEDLSSKPICSDCATKVMLWACRWCGGVKPRIASRGLNQSAKEFGQHYPQTPIVVSTAEHRVLTISDEKQLVFSTVGCEPFGRYRAVIHLGADREYSGLEMRSQERSRVHWAKLLTLLEPDGTLYLQMPRDHVAVQALLTGNPFLAGEKEIAERDELHLPPNFRLIRISGAEAELRKILPVLAESDVQVLGPFSSDGRRPRLLIKSNHDAVKPLLAQLAIVNRLLQSQGRDLLTLHLDPSELS